MKLGPVSHKTQFEYAWCLVRSKHTNDLKHGVALLEGKLSDPWVQAVGKICAYRLICCMAVTTTSNTSAYYVPVAYFQLLFARSGTRSPENYVHDILFCRFIP